MRVEVEIVSDTQTSLGCEISDVGSGCDRRPCYSVPESDIHEGGLQWAKGQMLLCLVKELSREHVLPLALSLDTLARSYNGFMSWDFIIWLLDTICGQQQVTTSRQKVYVSLQPQEVSSLTSFWAVLRWLSPAPRPGCLYTLLHSPYCVACLHVYLLYELWRGVSAGAEIQTQIQSRARNHGGGPRTKQPKYSSAKYS